MNNAPLIRNRRDENARRLIALALVCLAIDFIFVVFHCLLVKGWSIDPRFHLGCDGGFCETWNYFKCLAVCVMLFLMYRRERALIFLSWMAAFWMILADDSLQLHERGGQVIVISASLQPAFGLRAQDFGEMISWALMATVVGPVLVWGFFKSFRTYRYVTWRYLVVIAGLALFGVVADMVQIITHSDLWGLIEDGGETVMITAALVVTVHLFGSNANPAPTAQAHA